MTDWFDNGKCRLRLESFEGRTDEEYDDILVSRVEKVNCIIGLAGVSYHYLHHAGRTVVFRQRNPVSHTVMIEQITNPT